MDKKINKSFRIDSNVVNLLEQLSTRSEYSQTDIVELAICDFYATYFTGRAIAPDDVSDEKSMKDFMLRLETLRLKLKI